MKKLLTIIVILTTTISKAQITPVVGFGVGVNNSAPFHTFIEAGAEIGQYIVTLVDFKHTIYITNFQSIGLKSGLRIELPYGRGNDEYILLYSGARYYDYPLKYEISNEIKPIVGFRWQCYNVSTDLSYTNNFIFFSIGWQFRKLQK